MSWAMGGGGTELEKVQTFRTDREYSLSRGAWGPERSPVLMMTPISDPPSPATLARLEHTLSLREDLGSEWAARPVALARQHGLTTLVLEDPGGELLVQLMGPPWETSSFLRVAIELAAALGQLHARGLVHRDIKPANVVVDIPKGKVWLTGFGIASRLPRERRPPEPAEIVAGTLAYMAPEQTGRMNRSVDSRSDLYSYGITLYEMLTGTLPFEASDAMGWVHCHVAKQPPPMRQRAPMVPPPIAEIVEKLLAKSGDDRYQTAGGVEADLRECLIRWESTGRVDPFPIGRNDVTDQLLIPETLYGREAPIAALLDTFERVLATGHVELVLVSGYSGIGKSSVVNELLRPLVPPRGLFASGKFDQYKRDIPYATMAQAFHGLVRQLLSRDEQELSRWRRALCQALGANGGLIVNLIPELALVIGEPSPVPELPPQDAQRRFQLVFRQFLAVFARADHPLVLFVDDLQWLDAATLDLIEHLVTHPDVRHLMLVGAYRDNEVTPSHALMKTLRLVRDAGAPVQEIVLAPLTLDAIAHLVSDSLHCEPAIADPLARIVYEKTGGNPFFATQFFMSLAEEGLLTFDRGRAAWGWDLPGIHAKGFTDNVVDLMASRLRRLARPTREALGALACLGSVASIATLTLVRGRSEEELHAELWKAVHAGLLLRLEDVYAFPHDRVQEAAYSLIPDGKRAAAHLRIGRVLAAQAEEQLDDTIFDIASHFNRGAALITAQRERDRVAELNLRAARRAKASTAYSSALRYLISGFALLAEDCWEQRHDLAFAIEIERAECELLTGHQEAAEARLLELSRRATSLVSQAAVTCLMVELYMSGARSDRAVEVGLEYLRKDGGSWSAHPTDQEVRQAYDRMWARLGTRPIESLLDLPRMTESGARATIDVLTKLMPATRCVDENLGFLSAIHMANVSLEYGNADASACGYVWAASTAGQVFGDYSAMLRFGQLGVDLVRERGLDGLAARVFMLFGAFVIPFTHHFRSGEAPLRRALEAATQSGDLNYCAYAYNNLITNLFVRGKPLREVERVALEGLALSRGARLYFGLELIMPQLQLIRALQGMTLDLTSFSDPSFDESKHEQHLDENPALAIAYCWYWIRKMQVHVWANEPVAALAAGAKAQRLLWTSRSFFEHAEYHFYSALAHAACCHVGQQDGDDQDMAALAAHYQQIGIWAASCPENFADRKALVGAELARLEGRELDAERLYEEAIRSARENGFVQNEATANELAARFHAARGFATIADAYLRHARSAYMRWGADGKVRQLERRHPHLRDQLTRSGPTDTMDSSVEHMDWETVVKLSHGLSQETVLDKWVNVLMEIALEHAGAERGVLLIPEGGEVRPIAEAFAHSNDDVRVQTSAGMRPRLPQSVLRYACRTRESVLLDDAAAPNPFSMDPYVGHGQCRSVLCVPLVKLGEVIGLLYLENNLAPRAFTLQRVALLELVASHAAVSLDHARLFGDVAAENSERRKAEGRLEQRLVFERLVSDLSADLADCSSASLDACMRSWLERVSRFLDVDRAVFCEYVREADTLHTVAFWCPADQPPPPARAEGASLPETMDLLRRNEPFRYESREEMPIKDRWIMDRVGLRSVLGVPVSIESFGLGCLVLGVVREERRWPLDLIPRVRVIADILANAVVRRHAERDRKIQRELAEALEFRELVISILGHDLRSPLSAASALTQLIMRQEALPEVVRRRAAAIDSSMNRMNDLITTLLDFSESRFTGTMSIARTRTDLSRLCARVVEEQLAEHPGRVIVTHSDGPAEGDWDPVRMEQVVSNLISNALKHGDLTLPVHVRLQVEGEDAVLHVANEGGVIPRDVLGRLFEPFRRGPKAEPGARNGLGLGLYIVRHIALAHGGSVGAESTVERGTVFTVRLPLRGPDGGSVAAPGRPS